jgi:TolB protein
MHCSRAGLRRAAAIIVLASLVAAPAAACGGGGPKQLIVYEAAQGDVVNVYTVDPDSGKTHQLTRGTSFDGNPAWAPDRKRVIFSSRRDGQPNTDLYIMAADGSDVRRLTDTPDAAEYSAKYAPGAATIAYIRQEGDGWSLWVMNADATSQRKVAGPFAFAEFPAWTPDGTQVYLSAIEEGQQGGEGYAGGAAVISVGMATGEVRTRVRPAGPAVCPHFSRDGARLTYATTGTNGNLDIFAHDLASDDTSGAHDAQITRDPARDDYANPSPDDRTMVFVSDRDGGPDLYIMDRDGAHVRRLTDSPDLKENVPDW